MHAGSFSLGAVVVAAVALISRPATAEIINVPADYSTIQSAIDAALEGDEIVVAEGTYFESLDFLGKAITLRSTDPKDQKVVGTTIIDGDLEDPVITCDSGEDSDTTIEGFTIRNGFANDNDQFGGGGFRLIGTSPTISHCNIESNRSERDGAGIYVSNGDPVITHCFFFDNRAFDLISGDDMPGGGLYCKDSNPIVSFSILRSKHRRLWRSDP